jgi:hypothetical protein
LFPVISCRVPLSAPPMPVSGCLPGPLHFAWSTEVLHVPPPSYVTFTYCFIFVVP